MRSIAIRLLAVFAFAIPMFGQTKIDIDTRTQGSRLPFFSTDAGSANAYSITPVAPVTVLQTGSCFIWKATNANTTASTLTVSGFSVHNITKNGTTALVAGDIAANRIVETCYDGTQYQLLAPGSIATAGSVICSQLPALTGDVTSSAGSCATTLATVTVAKGGTGQTSLTNHGILLGQATSGVTALSLGAHQVAVGVSSADPTAKTVPDCTDTTGNHINFTQSTDAWSCGTSAPSPVRGISFTIGDPAASSALTVASTTTDYVTVPFGCTISAYNLAIDAGTITVKFWKIATGTAIPTSSNSISTSGVAISSGTAIHSTTVSDFTTTTITANDIMAMNVTAVATAKYVNGVLQCQ